MEKSLSSESYRKTYSLVGCEAREKKYRNLSAADCTRQDARRNSSESVFRRQRKTRESRVAFINVNVPAREHLFISSAALEHPYAGYYNKMRVFSSETAWLK